MKKIFHRREKCIGCAYCVEIAPEFWKMNEEDGKCDLLGAKFKKQEFVLEVFADEIEINEKAARICPAKCIKIL